MGVLMRNGKSYSNGSQIAISVGYNNTVSGLSATNVQNAIDEVGASVSTIPVWSDTVSCVTGDTSVTIQDSHITTSSAIELFKNTGTAPVYVTGKTITSGQVVITFNALTEATYFKVRISNNID